MEREVGRGREVEREKSRERARGRERGMEREVGKGEHNTQCLSQNQDTDDI
jgi:hypothetical protein